MREYAKKDALVTTEWVADHLNDGRIVLVEVDVDTELYEAGHIPGAVGWSWRSQLADTVRRDILSRDAFEELMSESGIGRESTVILYGDNNNWFAAWALWQMKVYGHSDVRLMDGGRKKWLKEGRPLSTDLPARRRTDYRASAPDGSVRAMLRDVVADVERGGIGLVDVRSPAEFTGEILAPPGLPETCQRGGHIPGASNIPWSNAVNEEDGTFRSAEELRRLYAEAGIDGLQPVITYCRIGERSSHSWFVLTHLLGMDNVRNYDGSWTEWGNLVGMPIERGVVAGAAVG
jgi:thiosulfate/3-mercaptopyruvate sulfurtransferase